MKMRNEELDLHMQIKRVKMLVILSIMFFSNRADGATGPDA